LKSIIAAAAAARSIAVSGNARELARHLLYLADMAEAALCRHPRLARVSPAARRCCQCNAIIGIDEPVYETPPHIEQARIVAKRELGL
jgi:hypothetical protein